MVESLLSINRLRSYPNVLVIISLSYGLKHLHWKYNFLKISTYLQTVRNLSKLLLKNINIQRNVLKFSLFPKLKTYLHFCSRLVFMKLVLELQIIMDYFSVIEVLEYYIGKNMRTNKKIAG